MKATLEFDLPAESEDHEVAVNALKWRSVVWEMSQFLRSQIKHGNLSESDIEYAEKVRTKLFDLMEEEGLGEL